MLEPTLDKVLAGLLLVWGPSQFSNVLFQVNAQIGNALVLPIAQSALNSSTFHSWLPMGEWKAVRNTSHPPCLSIVDDFFLVSL